MMEDDVVRQRGRRSRRVIASLSQRIAPRGGRGREAGLPGSEAQALAEETEAFLAGRSADWLSRRGRPVPAWAYINVLAHGTRTDITSQAGTPGSGAGPDDLVAALACQVLSIIDRTGISLLTLQHCALLPLESRLRELFGPAMPQSRAQLAEWLLMAISECMTPRTP